MKENGADYGRALYELASEEGLEEELLHELEDVWRLLKAEPAYLRLIDSYAVPSRERVELLDQAFGSSVHQYVLSTMKLLAERNALNAFHACKDAYEKAYLAGHGIVIAKIASAVELDVQQKKRLLTALENRTGKHIRPEYKLDPKLRGGMRIEVDGIQYDNSIEGKLSRLSRALSGQS